MLQNRKGKMPKESLMTKGFQKLTPLLLCLFISLPVWAEEKLEMAFSLRQSGKIYVVVGVVVLIFVGIVIYLIKLDRKVSEIESQENSKEEQ